MGAAPMLAMGYVIPLRWSGDEDLSEFVGYLRDLSRMVDVTVVEGSDMASRLRPLDAVQ